MLKSPFATNTPFPRTICIQKLCILSIVISMDITGSHYWKSRKMAQRTRLWHEHEQVQATAGKDKKIDESSSSVAGTHEAVSGFFMITILWLSVITCHSENSNHVFLSASEASHQSKLPLSDILIVTFWIGFFFFITFGLSLEMFLSFGYNQCLLAGAWKRMALLSCCLPRDQQVLHQRCI